MIKFGMIIGDRYEVLEKIGTGGMSDVYKAKDHKLNRFVAVKILKQEFSENANFVSKFRVEAQAAAGLMHANIVNVYDVGEENGIYYIVMELVEGITLKKYIEKKARLSVKEAISIAIQVSLGIEAAHNNHIIHRDIKPQNIMISKEGRVKVTDFGIAKAATSNTITSNVMGSVHYTSPEQARGGYSDEKSDIYSLGITLFEMLTGRVPFNGETTVAIAIKHIQESMPSPRDYVSEIPVSVEQIVLKCTQKSPDMRYQTMGELIEDLKRSLITPDENFVVMNGRGTIGETRMVPEQEVSHVKKQTTGRVAIPPQEHMRLNETQGRPEDKGSKQKSSVQVHRQSTGNMSKEEVDEDYNPKLEKITTVLMIIVAVIIGCIVLYVVARLTGVLPLGGGNGAGTEEVTPTETPVAEDQQTAEQNQSQGNNSTEENQSGRIEVPDVSEGNAYTQAEATKLLGDKGFEVSVEKSSNETVAKDFVISQTPAAGEKVAIGSTVTILVSEGTDVSNVIVPNILGSTQEAARESLTAVGLALGAVSEGFSDTYPAGQVYYQSFLAGGSVAAGTTVDINVSIGAEPRSYSCITTVAAPNDPEYSNSEATIMLVGNDNKIYYNQTTYSFPVEVNVSGIRDVSSGQIVINYTVSVTSTITDENGNSQTVTQPETRSETRDVIFTEE